MSKKRVWTTIIGFELLYKLLSAAVFAPIFFASLNLVMNLSGCPYLTLENVKRFFSNPWAILFLILLAILFSFYSLFDIGAVLFVLDAERRGQQVNLYQTVKFTFQNGGRVFCKKNVLLLLVILFFIPFLNLGAVSSYVSTMSLPSFVMSYIQKNKVPVMTLLVAWLILSVLLLRFVFSIHYFTLEQVDFKEARRRSANLIRGRKIKDALVLLLAQGAFYFCHFLFTVVGIAVILLVGKVATELHITTFVDTSVIWMLLMVTLIVVTLIGTPFCYGILSGLFYSHKKKIGEEIQPLSIPSYPKDPARRKKILIVQVALYALAFIGCARLVYRQSTENIDLQIEYLHVMEVTAHRGASFGYPENTMAAFVAAKEQGADWIELDVQQSKDGQIFVMHDRNFKRTTGVDKYSWELDYSEIAQLDAGSKLGKDFAGEKIPLLKEVIEFAKENDMRLNIEIKPAGFETDLEEKVVDLILEEEFLDRCVVTSQKYESLEKVKTYCEDVTTVYVMSLAYGNVNRLKYADHFSMEASSVTPSMVSRIHNAGKKIYAWTVNNRQSLNKMIDLNVDNIITDRVTMVQKYIYDSKTSTVVQKFVRYLRMGF